MTAKGNWRVRTGTRTSTVFGVLALAAVAVGFAAPLFASRGTIQDLFFILTMLVLAQNWNLLAGYAGLVSVGQQAFVGLGGYLLFAGIAFGNLDPLLAILAGGIGAALLAIPTAFFVFRLQGAYFAIGTWVVAEIVRLVIAQWKALGGGTGTSLPREATRDNAVIEFVGRLFDAKTGVAVDILAYWLALTLVVATTLIIYRLLRSRQGLGLAAMRDNVATARSVGVDDRRMMTLVYGLSAFLTGLAGALIYFQKARISPDAAFSVIDWTAYVIFIVVIGGIGTLEGPIIGVLIFFILQNAMADYGTWYLILLGLIGIAIMLFAPRGLWGLFSDRTGIELFRVRRTLVDISDEKTKQGDPHGRHRN